MKIVVVDDDIYALHDLVELVMNDEQLRTCKYHYVLANSNHAMTLRNLSKWPAFKYSGATVSGIPAVYNPELEDPVQDLRQIVAQADVLVLDCYYPGLLISSSEKQSTRFNQLRRDGYMQGKLVRKALEDTNLDVILWSLDEDMMGLEQEDVELGLRSAFAWAAPKLPPYEQPLLEGLRRLAARRSGADDGYIFTFDLRSKQVTVRGRGGSIRLQPAEITMVSVLVSARRKPRDARDDGFRSIGDFAEAHALEIDSGQMLRERCAKKWKQLQEQGNTRETLNDFIRSKFPEAAREEYRGIFQRQAKGLCDKLVDGEGKPLIHVSGKGYSTRANPTGRQYRLNVPPEEIRVIEP